MQAGIGSGDFCVDVCVAMGLGRLGNDCLGMGSSRCGWSFEVVIMDSPDVTVGCKSREGGKPGARASLASDLRELKRKQLKLLD